MRDPHDVLIEPLVTEKMTGLQESHNKVAFAVARDANKLEIKWAVEQALKVKVASVNVINLMGKRRRLNRFVGRTPAWKKAIITLKPGEKLEIFKA